MATRTRFKSRKSSQSGGKGATKTRRKSAATPTGQKTVGRSTTLKKNVKVISSPVSVMNTPTRKRNLTSKTKTSSTPKDEYEFDETDDFIATDSTLSSKNSNKFKTPSGKLDHPKSKKSSITNLQKKQKKTQSKYTVVSQSRPSGEKKKTSTPISESPSHDSKGQTGISRGKRRFNVPVPKLDLDMSVTPILPISTSRSPCLRQRARSCTDAKSVSFKEDSKLSQSQTPSLSNSRTCLPPATPRNPTSASIDSPFVSSESVAVTKKIGRKRKSPESTNAIIANKTEIGNSPAKQKKPDVHPSKQTLMTSEQQKISSKLPSVSKHQKKSTKKQTPTKQSKLPFDKSTLVRKSPRRQQPVTSTPVIPPEEQQTKKQTLGKKKLQVTPKLTDSGISMGEDLSCSTTPSYPGFMEDEPIESKFPEFFESSISVPSAVSSAEAAVYKSTAKEYKPTKTKREKGRYSTSRLEAWASAVNQSLEDVESFELVVE